MPGTNAGTGQPNWFRCYGCRKRHGTNEYFRRDGYLDTAKLGVLTRVVLTGKTRPAPTGRGGIRNSHTVRQYRCLDCGHVGWSRHVDLERVTR